MGKEHLNSVKNEFNILIFNKIKGLLHNEKIVTVKVAYLSLGILKQDQMG